MFMQNTLRSLERGKIYPRKELISIMKNENSEMSDNSLIWMIGDLVKRGKLVHIGRDQYALSDRKKDEYSPVYSQSAVDIKNHVAGKYPAIGFTVFESILLNEFLNHLIARNTIFIQTERDTSAFIFDFIRENIQANVLYKPSEKDYSRYWQPDMIVVLDWTSQAPLNLAAPHDITAEKMLVDIYCDKAIRMSYNDGEYQTIVEDMYERYNIDTVRLLRYAGRRNKADKIKAFLPLSECIIQIIQKNALYREIDLDKKTFSC